MKKIVSIIAILLVVLNVNAQVQRPANLPSSNSPSSWYTYFGILDSAKMSVERDSFPSKYPALIKHIDHNYYYTNGNGGPWYKLVDTSGLSYRINQRVQYSDTSAMLQNYKSNINYLIADTAYQAAQIAARVKYTDTASMLSGYGKNGQVVKYSDTASMLANRLKISDTSTMLVPYLRKSDTASMLSNRLKISDTSLMLTPYHQAFYTASFDTSARILYLVPITGGAPTAVLIPKGSASAGITTLTPYRTTGSNVQFLLADNGNKPGFSLNTTDSLTKVHYSDTAGIVSGYVRQGYPVLYNDTASMLSNRLKISDTTTMMSGYLRKGNATSGTVTQVNTNNGSGITGGSFTSTGTIAADTTVLSTKANVTASLLGKVNIADTSSMLSNYRRKTTLIQNSDLANSTISGISLGSNLNNLTFNNGGTGASSGTTYNGGTGQTISYNTIGAQPLATNLTSLSSLSYSSLSFVKMSASGTFSLDNNTYLTSSTGVTAFSGGSTGFTPNTLVSGSITLSGTLVAANGGTGYTSLTSLASDAAFTNAFQAKNTNLTSLSGLTYSSGTYFVKMTSAGTFGLDNNTYLTSSTGVTTFSAGTTGLTPSSATSGAITLAGTLGAANGGTGYTSLASLAGDAAFTGAFQAKNTNLTSFSGLSFVSTSFVKMTAAGTFALDVNTYLTTSSAASTYQPLENQRLSTSNSPSFVTQILTGTGATTTLQLASANGVGSINWKNGSGTISWATYMPSGTNFWFRDMVNSLDLFGLVPNTGALINGSLSLSNTVGTGTGALYAGAITSSSTGLFGSGVGGSTSIALTVNAGSSAIPSLNFTTGAALQAEISAYGGVMYIGTNGNTTALTINSSQQATFAGSVIATLYNASGTGSNSVAVGPYVSLVNTGNTYQMLHQLNASYGEDIWNYNGSWTKIYTLSATGAVTASSFINSTSDAQHVLKGDGSTDYFVSASFTPTIVNGAGVTSIAVSNCFYTRIGNIVTVSFSFSTGTTASGGSYVNMNVPISSTFGTVSDAEGSGGANTISPSYVCTVDTYYSSSKVSIHFPQTTTSQIWTGTYMYIVH